MTMSICERDLFQNTFELLPYALDRVAHTLFLLRFATYGLLLFIP